MASIVDMSTVSPERSQNSYNWNLNIGLPDFKRKRFLARKIHKLKKILKLRSKPMVNLSVEEMQNAENERIRSQNRDNEELERKYLDLNEHSFEDEENSINENWENWDACHMCAGKSHCYTYDHHHYQFERSPSNHSICYVFMPGQCEPIPVKLRSARIPGGVMWVSYRPDLDICASNYVCSYTSSFQPAQAQKALKPIMV